MNGIEALKEHIIKDIETLPEIYLKELLDFADFLKSKCKNEGNEKPSWKAEFEPVTLKQGKTTTEMIREERERW
ncbi:MAG: DUF2281 domain-containing protein [Spirochaetales bacterium]|nr:DUF2281 domain-containing protein [Spirochaetales bacterium]